MARRILFWMALRLMGWPNVTITIWAFVTGYALWARDPDLFQRAGALSLFSAFWGLTLIVFSLEEKKDVNDAVDLDETRVRHSDNPNLKSAGAKELWAETKEANTKFWQIAENNRASIEETIADRARGALIAGAMGSLQLGFGGPLMNSVLQAIEN